MRWLLTWGFNTLALFVAAWLLDGVGYGDSWWGLFVAGVVFTLINGFAKPVLTILSIPFIVVTLGLFYFLLNVLMLYLTDWIVPDFELRDFWSAALAAIIVSLVNALLRLALGDPRERTS